MSEEDSDIANHQAPLAEPVKPKEQAERKFGCPCGKWYLSYPALFTHVKQKHEGKPPGTLIKPKTDKARGRPRLSPNPNDDDQSLNHYDCVQELEKAIANKTIQYDEQYQFSEGNVTCQDMGSHFLKIMGGTGQQLRLLTCFINFLRFEVNKHYQESYWQQQKPTDIIDITNDIVRDLQENQKNYPLQKEVLIDLLYMFFRWMYKNKWTDHKLLRKSTEIENKPNDC